MKRQRIPAPQARTVTAVCSLCGQPWHALYLDAEPSALDCITALRGALELAHAEVQAVKASARASRAAGR